jgi:single-stranded-DNA-specific exonuclease
MQKNWVIKEADPDIIDSLSNSLGIDKIVAQILASRGIKTNSQAQRFLDSSLKDLYPASRLKDMDKVVGRIQKAISRKEKILIFSDYDVDGITSCAILEKELKDLGAKVSHYIPHRIKEGYGLSANSLHLAQRDKIKLFIALDCGINSFKEVELLSKHKIDVIIIDHHQPQIGALPLAYAIIDPKRSDCPYEFKNLAAVGLVYKLVCALRGGNIDNYLDLATLGTIADVAPLIDENRIIVKNGLEKINKNSNVGIDALIQASGLKDKEINPSRVSFILAPRINASGRVDSAEVSLELLLAQDHNQAQELAGHLNSHNRLRQKIEEDVFKEALDMVERSINFKEHYVIVLSREGWHVGVLGIVASKIAEKFFRPTIIISFKDGLGKGSGRSIAGFHLFQALYECRRHLKEFGGHSHAVGLNIEVSKLNGFICDLNNIARERMEMDTLRPVLEIDAQLPLVFLNQKLAEGIARLEPFGLGNPKPVFCSHNLIVKSPPDILGKDTIKFWVTDTERTYEAIGFGFKDLAPYIRAGQKIDLAYSLSRDNWQDVNSLLLEIKDLKFAD